jgi:nucleoside-diphosphate-sugar epimerase
LASLLSAEAKNAPQLAWDINVNGLLNVLETARLHRCMVFFPSSIGVFGPLTPPENTPQDTILHLTTMYGITKVRGELLCDYYHKRFGVDTSGVRYPGLISHKTLPHGGTTDYAVHIFYAALKGRHYDCFLKEGTWLDMIDQSVFFEVKPGPYDRATVVEFAEWSSAEGTAEVPAFYEKLLAVRVDEKIS